MRCVSHPFAKSAKGWGTEMMEQGLRGGAGSGVRGAELPGSGSRSAVFLIHTEVSGGAGRTKYGGISAGRFVKNRMLSHAEYERPVTGGTRTAPTCWLLAFRLLRRLGDSAGMKAGNGGVENRCSCVGWGTRKGAPAQRLGSHLVQP